MVDLDASRKRAEQLQGERDELSLAVDRLKQEVDAAVQNLEQRDQQVRHLQVDLAAAKDSVPDPQIAVQNAIALASHHALHQEQRIRSKAEEKISWLQEKLQETETLYQNERMEHSRSRRKIGDPSQPNRTFQSTATSSGPLAPYKSLNAGMTVSDSMPLSPAKGKKKLGKSASSGKLPVIKNAGH
jgi:chromosome segregation ATPase